MQVLKTIIQDQLPDLSLLENQQAASDIDDSHIQLTEEEKDKAISNALYNALQEKRSAYRVSEYWKKVNNPPPLPVFTAEQFLTACIRKWEKRNNQHFIIDDNNKAAVIALSLYFTKDPQFMELSPNYSFDKGLYLFGNVGCGKTTIMHLFASNPLASYIVISARRVAEEFARGGDDGKGGYPAIERYFGVYEPDTMKDYFRHKQFGFCFDDLGTETEKQNFGNKSNVLGEILLNRYDQFHNLKSKTHITSNLNTEEVGKMYGDRVRSRLREMVNLIEFPERASDRRR